MTNDVLQTVGQVAGIGGLALGVLLVVFRNVVRQTNVFPMLKKDHAYSLLRLIVVLTFTIAALGIGAWVYTEQATTSIAAERDVNIGTINAR